jgi:small subunit ribosomal protein S20
MANSKSSKKRALQTDKRFMINLARRSAIKTTVKKLVIALEAGKNKEEVNALFVSAQSQIRRAAGKGIVHINTASRKISRLAHRIDQVFASK